MLDLHAKKHAWILGGFEYLRADTDVEANPGSGGAEFKGDADAGGVIWPYAKLAFGASGTQTAVSATNPLPVGGSGAAALGKAEDAAHSSGDVGVPALAVRRDSEAVGSGTDGDYSTLNVDSSGRLRVNASGVNQPVTDAGGSLTIDTPQLPSAVGQNAAADSLSVVLASDHGGLPAGTNNIGDVDIASALPAGDNNIGNVDIASALPAGDNNIGNVDIASHPAGSLAGVTAKTSDYDTGAGTDTVPMMGLALPGSGGAVAGGTSTNPVRTDPTGTTAQPITDNGASVTVDSDQLPATLGQKAMSASLAVVLASDQASVPVAATLAAETTKVIGTVNPGNTANTTPWLVSPRPAAAGGHSIYRLISAASTNAANVKSSAGQVYGGIITNINAAARYLKIYNLSGSPTVGTSTPVLTLAIPGNTAGAGMTFTLPNGIAFDTGISVAITTGATDADTGAVAANEIIVNLFYT